MSFDEPLIHAIFSSLSSFQFLLVSLACLIDFSLLSSTNLLTISLIDWFALGLLACISARLNLGEHTSDFPKPTTFEQTTLDKGKYRVNSKIQNNSRCKSFSNENRSNWNNSHDFFIPAAMAC